MAKVSPVSIKYLIHADFLAEGALEKPDVIGALFGQTEGLLGSDLEMRDLQKEGKIGRIEVELERKDKRTVGKIFIPTALDQSETTLIAASIETIERIGPCDAQIEIEKIEDVRGSKRDYIIERAKKLMQGIQGATDSREISNEIKVASKTSSVESYGKEKLPVGDISGKELIVVEGRADVVNLLKNGINNVIGMDGTKLPEVIKELSKEKDITLFVDGDRGGRLIAKNVFDNAKVKYVAVAPEGKEVEELTGKEILMNLRKKVSADYYFKQEPTGRNRFEVKEDKSTSFKLDDNSRKKLKEIASKNNVKGQAILLNNLLKEIKQISVKGLGSVLRNARDKPAAIIIDGTATRLVIKEAENLGCKAIVAKNFATTDTKIELLSF